nr:RNA-directed DNA polymerase, eukaryota, reverse transcriptase zinc-binding domain protein [Tanacetum cinerariifolium]
MSKSKIMGINVNSVNVQQATKNLRCLILKIPFMFLGSLVGGYSLWARVIKAIYGEDGKIGSNCKGGSKTCWSSIVNEDLWHMDGILKVRFPRMYALELDKSITIGEKLGHHTLSDTFRRCPRGGMEQAQFDDLVTCLQQVSMAPCADRWIWTRNSTGIFTVASARQFIDGIISAGGDLKTSWNRFIPNKVNIHAWKVMMNGLATKYNMSRRDGGIFRIMRWSRILAGKIGYQSCGFLERIN